MMSERNEAKKNQLENIFEEGSVPKVYFHFAIPLVMGMVISLIYNMVDTYFIAKTGNTNLIAGVSLCSPVFTLMIAMGDIMGLGGSSVISRMLGDGNKSSAGKISAFSYYASIILGVLAVAALLIFRAPILKMLGADDGTMIYASQYFTGLAIGAPFIILNFTPNNQLRTEGLAKESMAGSVMGTVVNMILDPIFILMLGWGAAGAAAATVIGYICTNIYYLYILRTRCEVLSVNPENMRVSGKNIREILVIGIPASVTNLMQSFAIAMTNRMLLPYGNDKIAAMGIVIKIHMVVVLVLVGFAFGGQPLFGYLYGAKNRERLMRVIKFAYGAEIGMGVVMAGLIALGSRGFVSLFIHETGLVESGSLMLRMQLSSIAFMAVSLVSTCIFQSTGKALGALAVSLSRQGVVFLAVLLFLNRTGGYYGILLSQPVSDLITAAIALAFFYRGLYREIQGESFEK